MKIAKIKILIFFVTVAIVISGFIFEIPKIQAVATINKSFTKPPNNLGLVGYWTMDGNKVNWATGAVTDSSGQGNTGTIVNMATSTAVAAGKHGQALSFDGVDDYVATNKNLSTFIGESTSTISVWLYPTSFLSSTDVYWGYLPGVVMNEGADIWITIGDWNSDNKIWVGLYDVNSPPYPEIGVTYSLNQWTHIVMVHANKTLYAYKNGVLWGSTPAGDIYNINGGNLVIGRDIYGEPDTYFNGLIDEVRVYNRALTPSEVEGLYNSGAAKLNISPTKILTSGLVGYWTMDGNKVDWATGAVTDSSGKGNTGTIVNMATSTAVAAGKHGQALSFDGTDDYVDLGTGLNQQVLTLSAWVKPNTMTTLRVVVSKDKIYELDNDGENKVLCVVGNGSWGTPYAYSASTYTVGAWNHFACIFDGTNLTAYLNGVAGTPVQPGLVPPASSDAPVSLGHWAYGSGYNWDGLIDEVRIYNRALGAGEITQLYNMGK